MRTPYFGRQLRVCPKPSDESLSNETRRVSLLEALKLIVKHLGLNLELAETEGALNDSTSASAPSCIEKRITAICA